MKSLWSHYSTPETDKFAASWNLDQGHKENGDTYGWGSLKEAVDKMREFEKQAAYWQEKYEMCQEDLASCEQWWGD